MHRRKGLFIYIASLFLLLNPMLVTATEINQSTNTENEIEEAEKQEKDINKIEQSDQNKELKKDIYDDHLIQIKENLEKLGFPILEDEVEYFGENTEKVVKQFQEYYNLPVHGEIDSETLLKIDELLSSPFQIAERHEDTIKLKADLATLGYYISHNPTDLYGKRTRQAVEQFQADHELIINGIADEITLEKIETLLKEKDEEDTVTEQESDQENVESEKTKAEEKNVETKEEQTESVNENELKEKDTIQISANQGFKNGDRHPDVIQLKKDLAKVGFPVSSNPTDLYGTRTENVVKEFQSYYGLDDTGIADQQIFDKLESILSSPLQRGKRHEDTITLKNDLADLGFPVSNNPTELYGVKTERVVIEFQEYYGLVANGIADEVTLSKIEELLGNSFNNGQRHPDVIQLKKDLAKVGFPVSSNPTDLYGTRTENVVKEFQSYYGLKVTGKADVKTLDKIESILSSPLQKGQRHEDTIQLKKDLARLGFPVSSTPTELYGTKTAEVVKEFQKHHDLVPNGIADEVTLAKINVLFSEIFQIGQRHKSVIVLKENLEMIGFKVSNNPTNLYGSKTAQVVKDFQKYYGLNPTGNANKETFEKIDNILSSPLQIGGRHKDAIQLKKDLDKLGFFVSSNPTELYGSKTAAVVTDFQNHYKLVANGIADPTTLAKMEEILNSPYRDGQSGDHIVKMKEDLVLLGFANWSNPSPNFGKNTEQAVKRFQSAYGLPVSGIADEITLAKIEELVATGSYNQETKYDLSLDEAVAIQMKATPQTDSNYAWVSSSYINSKNQVTANALNVRKGPGTSHGKIGTLSKGTRVKVLDRSGNWLAIEYNSSGWVHAHASDVRYYLDPTNFLSDKKQQFQFLDLSKTSGAPVKKLNEYLKGKGVLQGQGQSFIEAGKKHGINEIYLISHALLETGHGTSTLATGVKYNGVTVHNMYGIGAYDSCPVNCGAEHAYEEGWTTVKSAIIGGAGFIGNNYIKSGQNTIYKMRWNPEAMASEGKFGKQYATDVGWASKQVNTMYNLYEEIGLYNLILEIPVYK